MDLGHQPTHRPELEACRELLDHRILLVDDTDMVRTIAVQMLEIIGCTVVSARSGQEAIDIVATQDFDLILMDIQMPVLDGLETTRRLLRLHPERGLKIAAVTAHASTDDVARSREAGMIGQLNKPFTVQELDTFVRQTLKLKG
jgi:CheY-like chemotaxis protein